MRSLTGARGRGVKARVKSGFVMQSSETGATTMCARKTRVGTVWSPSASVLVVPHASHRSWVPARLRSGRGSDAAVQARLDTSPYGIPRGCQLSSQSCNGGSRDARLSDRPADRPHTQTRPGSTHRVVLLNESHDPAGAFAAHPAPYCATRSAQDPGPGRVDHLHHHTPVALSDSAHTQGSQPAGCTTQHRTPEPLGCELHSSDGNPPNRRADHTDHTDHNDQAAQNSSR